MHYMQTIVSENHTYLLVVSFYVNRGIHMLYVNMLLRTLLSAVIPEWQHIT